MTTDFIFHTVQNSRIDSVNLRDLPFGSVFSDHQFQMNFKNGEWQQGEISPYGDMSLSPAAMALHYGQAIFEGMKAFRQPDGSVALFRPMENIRRFNKSAERMCMAQVDEGVFLNALIELIRLDSQWVPDGEGSSLYIRPFMFASEEHVGVRPSAEYRFIIFTCPVGPYYKGNVRVKVEKRQEEPVMRKPPETMQLRSSQQPWPTVKAMTRSCGQMLWSTNTLRRAVP